MIDHLEADLRDALASRASELPAGAGARLRQLDYHPRSRRVRPPVAFGALAGAAGTAAVAVSVVGLGAGAANAFAGWTPSPTTPSSAQTASADAACETRLASLPNAAAATSMSPVLTDTRGPFTFVIFSGTGGEESCISGPAFTALSARSPVGANGHASASGSVTGQGGPGSLTSVKVGASPDSGPPASGTVEVGMLLTTSQDGQDYTVLEGRTGSDVTGTTLVLADGTKVSASVANGWFAAWWPGAQQATSAEVTTPSGVTTQQLDAGGPVDCGPSPCSGSAGTGTSAR